MGFYIDEYNVKKELEELLQKSDLKKKQRKTFLKS